MNKELFVSATPHETKVGITEDDQLAEIYLERENEYTLAGSIYKGRVTRVLPGMQSAFVDIGLERDAFLYVSDFMDLEQQDEDLDEAIPANRPVTEARPRNGLEAAAPAMEGQVAGVVDVGPDEPEAETSEAPGVAAGSARDFRGRRRRRGRRGEIGRGPRPERGEIRSAAPAEAPNEPSLPRTEPRNEGRNDRFNRGDRPARSESDSRFQRPTPAPTARVGRDYDYGPPPGYQPIVLPGESISKYQRQGVGQSVSEGANESALERADSAISEESAAMPELPRAAAIEVNFSENEPVFTTEAAEPLHEQHEHEPEQELEEVHGASASAGADSAEIAHKVRVLAELYSASETIRETPKEAEFLAAPPVAHEVAPEVTHEASSGAQRHAAYEEALGAVEEQEIEEEEADLTSYGEEPGDDEGFEELEEETRAAGSELPKAGTVAARPR